jgi:hypothetical protein
LFRNPFIWDVVYIEKGPTYRGVGGDVPIINNQW